MNPILSGLAALMLALEPSAAQSSEPARRSSNRDGESPISVPEEADADTSYELGKMVIKGSKRPARRESEFVARMPLKNLENPQAYSMVTKELTGEQMAVDFKSAFKNVAGAGQPQVTVQGLSRYATRGFYSANQIRNGMPINTNSDVDLANVERIEAVRGPSGTLFGTGGVSYGGLFNRVTKRPYETFGGEVSYSGGSWNLSRLTADVNMPLNAGRTALLRVNTALHKENSDQDQGFSDTWMIAPSLSYQASDRLKVIADAEIYERKGTSAYLLGVSGTKRAHSVDQLPMDWSRSYTNNSLVMETPAYNLFGQAEYRISDGWTSQTDISYGVTKPNVAGINRTIFNDSLMRLSQMRQFWSANTEEVRQNLLGDFKLLSMRHRLLLGADFLHQNEDWTYASINMDIDTINLNRPRTFANIDMDLLEANAAKLAKTGLVRDTYDYGAYVSDAVDLTDRFTLLLGLRFDKFDNRGQSNPRTGITTGIYEQKAWSPKAGLVYQPIKERLSVFANYMNGYKNVTANSFTGEEFVPEQANQTEVGVKADIWDGRISGTVSSYYILVENTVRSDLAHPTFSIQDGNQESRGVEVDLTLNPFAGLSLLVGYAYNESQFTEANADVLGRRPANSGPEQSANIWASYKLNSGAARGLGLGFGGNYSGKQYYSNTATYQFSIPSYTLVDATVFYDRPSYRVGLKADNLTDELYWGMYLAPQPGRRFIGNVTYKF